ncbi:hypothetical protein FIC_02230 [Flavobacteriaceae bacterium 3519-10]|nr:hypothetical protein FIC_02230 [Flavobacteriaceae bacterium 3519-10]
MNMFVFLTFCCTFLTNPHADFQQIYHIGVLGSGNLMYCRTHCRTNAVRTNAVNHMVHIFFFQARICAVITRRDAGSQFL